MTDPTPGLYNLIVEKKYTLVINRTISHPHDICWRDDRNNTVFHRLCYLPGVDRSGEQTAQLVIHMLRAAEKVNFCCVDSDDFSMWNGARALVLDQGGRSRWSPLHLVSMHCGYLNDRHRLMEAILIFDDFGNDPHNILGMNSSPLSNQQKKENIDFMRVVVNQKDRQGRTALHHLLRLKFSASRVQPCVAILLSVDPGLICSQDNKGKTSLTHCFSDVSCICLKNHDKYIVAKFILDKLEKSSFDFKHNNDISCMNKRGNSLHFILSLPRFICPQILILSLISNNSHLDEFQELDEDSNLPLHVFVSNETHFTTNKMEGINDNNETLKRIQGRTNSHNDTIMNMKNKYQDMIIAALIDKFPESLKRNGKNGKSVTDMAIESGVSWNSGLTRIFSNVPTSHGTIDLDVQLYPFLLAKISKIGEDESSRLSMLYNMILAKPDILKEDCSHFKNEDEEKPSEESQKVPWRLNSLFRSFRKKHLQ